MSPSFATFGRAAGCLFAMAAVASAASEPVKMDPLAQPVPYDPKAFAFSPDPVNTLPYDYQRQLDIYGAKHMNPTARPLLELGRELYGPGQLQPGINLFGAKNLAFPQVLLYGDFRAVTGYNDTGADDRAIAAAKLTLDLDVKLTATERVHATFTPLDKDGKVTRLSNFNGSSDNDLVLDAKPDALFFEGDLARIASGITNQDNGYDIPFTAGLIPLLFQNGVWMQDAITGFAFTIPARNSPRFQISNMDVTFFAGFDEVDSAALPSSHHSSIYGVATFIDAMKGYFEFDYAYVDPRDPFADLGYHNFGAAFTRRYFDLLSNSVRVIANFGQNPGSGRAQTADGLLILLENSFITSSPSTLVPYLNGWIGFDHPQSAARATGAGGVLLNTGINFESDGITGFPTMDDTAADTYGAALGLEYLFDLSQQLVVEVAALDGHGDHGALGRKDPEYGLGARYQRKLNHAWIFRADAIAVARENAPDFTGARVELRRKF